jgi:mono/diheme cytochrome c family protein
VKPLSKIPTSILVVLMFLSAACAERAEVTGAGAASQNAEGQVASQPEDLVKRGEYLVTIGGCHDCHTPFKMTERGPEPDMELMLSGHPEKLVMPPPPEPVGPWIWSGAATNTAFAGPWGVSYAINLTPDEITGMGIWTEEMFINAMRTGKHFGTSRPIMPPMPWQNLSRATDEDLRAIYAYLRSIKPITNRVPEYQPPAG